MTGKDNLTDEDKAVLEQMLKKREESRKKQASAPAAAPVPEGDLAKRWASETFLGDEEADGLNVALPRTTPVGIVAIGGPGGVALYRDGRCRFSVAIPGKPTFVTAGGGLDATCTLADAAITISLIMIPPQPGTPLADQVAALAGDVTQARPVPLGLDQPGVSAASIAVLRQGNEVRTAAVLAGGAPDAQAIMILMFDHDRATVDAASFATIRAAVLGSAAFTPEPRRRIPVLFPDSPWLEPGLPLRPRAGRPAVPTVAEPAALADRLLATAGDLPPDRALDEPTRAAAGADLAAAGAASAAHALAAGLATAHDLRGLALAVLSG